MNTVTHALLPVVTIAICERLSKTKTSLNKWQYSLIALFGAAPDLLTPHFSIEGRHESWSHTIVAWAVLSICLFVISLLPQKILIYKIASFMSISYLIHLCCDALSGGIPWLLPFSDIVHGRFIVSPAFWIPIDIVLVLAAYLLVRTYRVTPR